MRVEDASTAHVVRLQTDTGITLLKAWLPETWGLRLSNQWNPTFAETIQGAIDSTSVGKGVFDGLSAVGITPRAQAATALIWQGSSAVEFSLPLKMHAKYSSRAEILTPLRAVIQQGLPTVKAGMFVAPTSYMGRNNKYFDTGGGGKEGQAGRLDLFIGNYIWVTDVVIVDIDFQAQPFLDSEGHPMRADFTLSLSTAFTPSANDVLQWLPGDMSMGPPR